MAVAVSWAPVAIALGAVSIATYGASLWLRQRRRKEAQTELTGLRADVSVSTLLFRTAQSLSFGQRIPGWRMSLYRLDPERRTWVECGRAAANAHYERSSRLPALRDVQGVLRGPLASADRAQNVADVTQVLEDPDEDLDAWISGQESWGINAERARLMRMRSRVYWGQVYRVHRSDQEWSTLGVVIESETGASLAASEFQEVIGRPYFEALDAILMISEKLDLDPSPLD